MISISMIKNSGRPAAVEKDECGKIKKSMENTSIDLYRIDIFYCKKIAKN